MSPECNCRQCRTGVKLTITIVVDLEIPDWQCTKTAPAKRIAHQPQATVTLGAGMRSCNRPWVQVGVDLVRGLGSGCDKVCARSGCCNCQVVALKAKVAAQRANWMGEGRR
jgi:hypothetical protein